MTDSAILRFNRNLLFELETDGTPEGSIVTAPFSETIPSGGPILTFESEVETIIPLIVDINLVQEGTGDPSPSNVRPISGYTDVNVNVCGVNVWDEEWEATSSFVRSKNYIPVRPNTQYYWNFSVQPENGFRFYDSNKTQIGGVVYSFSSTNNVITTPNDCYFINFNLGGAYGTTYNYDGGINYPATDHEYHAYQGTSYPISLGQTVYGGTLDVVSGKLTITHTIINLGSLTWTTGTDSIGQYFKVNYSPSNMAHPTSSGVNANAVCERYAISNSSNVFDGSLAIGWSAVPTGLVAIYCRDTTCETLSAFLTTIANTKLAYELNTSTEVTLTPTEVKSLIGLNNIWSNSGDVYTAILTENVKYKITGGVEDVQRFNKIWESLLLYRNEGLADKYRNLSGEGYKIIPHDPAVLKEE